MSDERDAVNGGAPGIAADASGARWTCTGPLTFAEAGPVLAATSTIALPSEGVVDCGGIGAFDSAAVAVMLSLQQRAAAEGRPLKFTRLPARLIALATLYGVEEMLAG